MNGSTWVLAYTLTTLFIISAGTAAGQGYEIDWHTIDGGGVSNSSGSGYELSGTVAQHDAGSLAGGSYALTGGFWQTTAIAGDIPCHRAG